MLGEAGGAGIGVRSDAGIVLVVILEGDGVFCGGDPIEIGDGLIGAEVGGAGGECVFGKGDGGDETVGGGDEELAVGELVVEEAVGDGADVARGGADGGVDGGRIGEIAVDESGEGSG